MKKIILLSLTLTLILTGIGCGKGQSGDSQGTKEPQYADALDVLKKIVEVYKEEDLFAMYGGNQEAAVMDEPGKFDISKTEELTVALGLPENQISVIDDAASMVHMMNANIFTGAVYHLKDGTDSDAFADEVKTNILNTQWICGQPDTLLVINAGGNYMITAYGEAEIMKIFKANAESALEGAQVVIEAPIA